MGELLLEMKGITKTFTKCVANKDVDLSLYSGEIHALLGENGAGKSTLMNVLTGIYKPDDGEIYYKGKKQVINSPKHAVQLGIGMVHQHFRLVNNLTVAENIILNSGECPFFIDEKDMNEKIGACSKQFGLQLSPEASIWQLSVGEQQRVEIVKLLYRGAEILILDEPSAVLTPQESVEMFKTLRTMANSGKAVVFISHKMNEVIGNADRITVLRGGRSVATKMVSETNIEELTMLMVGHELPHENISKSGEVGDLILECKDLCTNNDRGLPALRKANLKLHKGEILGIAGVAGNGQKMLAECITGNRKITGGQVIFKDKDVTNASIGEHVKMGISFVPEDRLGMGLVPTLDMMDNLILKRFARPQYSKNGILKKADIRKATEDTAQQFDIKNAGVQRPVRLMSGGNQQKLLVAREISGEPDLLVVSYPVRGLDIGAVDAIHKMLLAEKERGAAILLISEEIDEVFELSDKLAVLFDGYLSDLYDPESITRQEVGYLMAGVGLDEAREVAAND